MPISTIQMRHQREPVREHQRFRFFLPPPAGALAPSWDAGTVAGTFGVAALDASGAGVAEERCCVVDVSDGTAPARKELEAEDIFECAAVARIAFSSSILFCCLFGVSDALGALSLEMDGISSSVMGMSSSVLCFFVLPSSIDGSMMGHTKPVRGV